MLEQDFFLLTSDEERSLIELTSFAIQIDICDLSSTIEVQLLGSKILFN